MAAAAHDRRSQPWWETRHVPIVMKTSPEFFRRALTPGFTLDTGKMPGQNGCESCHGAGSKHVAAGGGGPEEKFIVNPGKDPQSCYECHAEIMPQFHLPEHHPVPEGK